MIKFLDLYKINERFRDEIDARIKQVLDSGWYLLGGITHFILLKHCHLLMWISVLNYWKIMHI